MRRAAGVAVVTIVLLAIGFALRGPVARWMLRFGLDDEAIRRLERSGELPAGALSAIARGEEPAEAGARDGGGTAK